MTKDEALAQERSSIEQQTDWEAVAADQALTIGLLKAELQEFANKEADALEVALTESGWMWDGDQWQRPAQQEPVAWICHQLNKVKSLWWDKNQAVHLNAGFEFTPLYTSPPTLSLAQRQSRSDVKPLTDEQLRVIENKINPTMRWRSSDEEGITLYPIEYYELVRAIEAAHGIKGDA